MSSFMVSDTTLNDVVRGFLQVGFAHDKANWLGNLYTKLNASAVRQRYGRNAASERRPFSWDGASLDQTEAGMATVIKAVHCLHYQCAEGDIPTKSAHELLAALAVVLEAEFMVTYYPGANRETFCIDCLEVYDAAPWT